MKNSNEEWVGTMIPADKIELLRFHDNPRDNPERITFDFTPPVWDENASHGCIYMLTPMKNEGIKSR